MGLPAQKHPKGEFALDIFPFLKAFSENFSPLIIRIRSEDTEKWFNTPKSGLIYRNYFPLGGGAVVEKDFPPGKNFPR